MTLQGLYNYVVEALRVTIPICMLLMIVRGIYLSRTGKKISIKKEGVLGIFVFYMICLYSITVFRADISLYDIFLRREELQKINIIPLVEMVKLLNYGYIWSFVYNFIGNIAWFVPFGFLLPMIKKKPLSFFKVVGMGALVSLSIECLQFIVVTGISDVDDIIFNATGAGIGYVLWKVIRGLKKEWMIYKKTKKFK